MPGRDMYRVGVNAELVAQHRLVGGDFGIENELHTHHYRVELELSGHHLDHHGFLVNIAALKARLSALLARLDGVVLNNLPELAGQNPSVENFAAMIARALVTELDTQPLTALAVKVWEDSSAWAALDIEL